MGLGNGSVRAGRWGEEGAAPPSAPLQLECITATAGNALRPLVGKLVIMEILLTPGWSFPYLEEPSSVFFPGLGTEGQSCCPADPSRLEGRAGSEPHSVVSLSGSPSPLPPSPPLLSPAPPSSALSSLPRHPLSGLALILAW